MERSNDNLLGAIRIAMDAHENDTYNNQPYILHPLRVMLAVNQANRADQVVAVLHDVIEDHPEYREVILGSGSGFHSGIVQALNAITRREDENYKTYILRVAENPCATRVKLVDLHDNLSQMQYNSSKEHLRSRYIDAIETLERYGKQ